VISPEVSRGEDAGVRSRDGRRALWRKRKRTGISIQAALIEQEGLAQILDVDPGLAPVDPRRQLRELRRVGVLPKGLALKDLRRWPAEPSPPARWDESRFAAALSGLCPVTVERASVEAYSRIMLRSAQLFGVDASLLAALSYQQSGCSAARRSAWGVGLTMLNAGLFPGDVARERRYPYGRLRAAQWEAVTLPLPQYPFLPEKLDEPSANLYFAAALLRVFEEQCPHIDAEFRSLPHRHPVSHFIWGDVVQDAGVEDRILTARRRFLAHYHAGALPPSREPPRRCTAHRASRSGRDARPRPPSSPRRRLHLVLRRARARHRGRHRAPRGHRHPGRASAQPRAHEGCIGAAA
jgi:hypothetical protein